MPQQQEAAAVGARAAPWWRRARAFFSAYEADETDAAAFRARQLQSVLRLTPVAMGVNLFNVAVVCSVLRGHASALFLLLWSAAVLSLAGAGFRGWWVTRRNPRRARASRRALRHAAWQGALLAAAWGLLPALQFAQLDPELQFFVGMVTTGMICAGGFALSGVPVAATVWVAVLGSGAMAALLQADLAHRGGVMLMLGAYCLTVVASVWTSARTLGARLVAEARADRQHEVIGLLLRDFEDHASDLLWELDARGRFTHVSQRLSTLLGLPPPALRRLRAVRLLGRRVPDKEDARAHWQALRALLQRGSAFRDQVVAFNGAAGPSWWSVSARPLFDETGHASGWRGVAADVTEKHLAHRRLSWMAHNDALTGLVNRTQFLDLLQALLRGPSPAPLAVVLLDLDGFKQINDTRGHAAGDRCLKRFGERLLSVARRSDTVARLGGDEFALLVRGPVRRNELESLLERVQGALQAVAEGDEAPPLKASMGVAIAPADGHDVDALMQHADIALYAAKRAGGHRWCFFDSALAEAGRRRHALEEALQGAVERGEFRLEYQPQVSTHDWGVHGFEALLRWQHPQHGAVPPAEFVPIAEDAGLMPVIGQWVLQQACREAAGWPGAPQVSINVSATQLGTPDFVARVEAAAAALDPSRVELEITESALIDDVEAAVSTLGALRDRGFRIALDDFGTGYSALGYLRRFPFDTLKIDRSFVHDLALDGEARVIIDTILAMARALGMTAIAEGVERPDEARMLRERGCAALQGYLIASPMAAAAVAPFLRSWETRRMARLFDEATAA